MNLMVFLIDKQIWNLVFSQCLLAQNTLWILKSHFLIEVKFMFNIFSQSGEFEYTSSTMRLALTVKKNSRAFFQRPDSDKSYVVYSDKFVYSMFPCGAAFCRIRDKIFLLQLKIPFFSYNCKIYSLDCLYTMLSIDHIHFWTNFREMANSFKQWVYFPQCVFQKEKSWGDMMLLIHGFSTVFNW
jgi:hypothetical protein